MKEIRLFRLRQWILQYIQRLFRVFRSLQVPYSQKNFTLPSVLQCSGKTDSPASSAEMQQSPSRWNNAKPQSLQQQHVELPGRAPCWEKEKCLPDSAVSRLGLALLPPSHSLTVCAGCENCHCTSWSRFKFHMGSKMLVMTMWIILPLCCSITITIPSLSWLHLTDKALRCSCNQEPEYWPLEPFVSCLAGISSHTAFCGLFEVSPQSSWPFQWGGSGVAPFQQGDVLPWATNTAVKSLTDGCSLAAAEAGGCTQFAVAL